MADPRLDRGGYWGGIVSAAKDLITAVFRRPRG